MKRYSTNWVGQLPNNKVGVKVKDFSRMIPLRIDSRTTILIGVNDNPEKKREEYIKKHGILCGSR